MQFGKPIVLQPVTAPTSLDRAEPTVDRAKTTADRAKTTVDRADIAVDRAEVSGSQRRCVTPLVDGSAAGLVQLSALAHSTVRLARSAVGLARSVVGNCDIAAAKHVTIGPGSA